MPRYCATYSKSYYMNMETNLQNLRERHHLTWEVVNTNFVGSQFFVLSLLAFSMQNCIPRYMQLEGRIFKFTE